MPDPTDTPKPPSAPCPVATSEARCPDCDRVLATQADSDALAGDWPKTPAMPRSTRGAMTAPRVTAKQAKRARVLLCEQAEAVIALAALDGAGKGER